jgi:hypothetical protein
MAIASRSSDDHLHTDVILGKISEYDIFMYYIPEFKKLGKKFRSSLRSDKTPTVSIIAYNGKLLYKDFGNPEHTFDCFHYVRHKYGCSFIDALRIVDCDFRLGLSSVNSDSVKYSMGMRGFKHSNIPKFHKPEVIIQKRKRLWTREDANFWSKYLISKKILTMFAVEPISHFWVNNNRFSCNTITYAFRFKSRFKIYSPYEVKNKWLSNTNKDDIQGYKQLPKTGDRLIITSSLKDVMCLYSAGYNSIAMQSEMQIPSEKLISELKERFNKVDILYDNDFDKQANPGQTMARKLCDLYGLENVYIPNELKSKDPSDLVNKVGNFNKLKNIIK